MSLHTLLKRLGTHLLLGNGYDVYDLYDLGEFDQKGGVTTKWGTKEEYISAIATAKKHGIVIYVGRFYPFHFLHRTDERCRSCLEPQGWS